MNGFQRLKSLFELNVMLTGLVPPRRFYNKTPQLEKTMPPSMEGGIEKIEQLQMLRKAGRCRRRWR
jgi:hypothetical protein